MERDCRVEYLQLFGESVRQPGDAAAVYPQGVVLLFDVRHGNPLLNGVAHERHALAGYDSGRGTPTSGVHVGMRERLYD